MPTAKTMTAYEIPTEQLMGRFMGAAMEAGIGNSGICVDMMAREKFTDMHYYCGVVRARIDGKQPPIQPGTVVKLKDGSRGCPKEFDGATLTPGMLYTVYRVWYDAATWRVSLRELLRNELKSQYMVDDLDVVKTPT